MKILVGVLILGIAFFFLFNKKKGSGQPSKSKQMAKFYSLDDGNQNELLISIEISKEWLDSIQTKYDWNDFDEYDNRMWEYMYKLFDETVEKSGVNNDEELWLKLNRPQKLFWAFLAFNGDTDNGGVDQFVSNRYKFIYAVSETWKELKIEEVDADYSVILGELENGKVKLKSTLKLENYYYDKKFKKKLYKKVADLIENNIDKFAKVNH